MGSADGHLFYSAQGTRVVDLSEMPKWLQQVQPSPALQLLLPLLNRCYRT